MRLFCLLILFLFNVQIAFASPGLRQTLQNKPQLSRSAPAKQSKPPGRTTYMPVDQFQARCLNFDTWIPNCKFIGVPARPGVKK